MAVAWTRSGGAAGRDVTAALPVPRAEAARLLRPRGPYLENIPLGRGAWRTFRPVAGSDVTQA